MQIEEANNAGTAQGAFLTVVSWSVTAQLRETARPQVSRCKTTCYRVKCCKNSELIKKAKGMKQTAGRMGRMFCGSCREERKKDQVYL